MICSYNFFLSPGTDIIGDSLYTIICRGFFGGLLFRSMHRVDGTQGKKWLGDNSFTFALIALFIMR